MTTEHQQLSHDESTVCKPCRDCFEERLPPSRPRRVYKGSLKHLDECSCPFCFQLFVFFHKGEAKNSIVKKFLDLFRTVDPDAFEIRLSPRPPEKVMNGVKNQLQISSPSIKSAEYHYFDLVADHGSEAAALLPDRPTMSNTLSDTSFDVIKEWMITCDNEHEKCKLNQPQLNTGPRRLLNLFGPGLDSINLVNTSVRSTTYKYAALSYCWGNPAEDKQAMTTMENVKQHEQGIQIASLPKTIQHAVLVARKLGIPYLWVDALCIVQDAKGEKKDEMAKMGSIYSNAYLTIAASNSAGCSQGFLRPGEKVYYVVPYSHHGQPATTVKMSHLGGAYPRRWTLDKEPLHKRGWTFQEMMLSRRIVFFSDVQPYWRCPTTSLCRGGPDPSAYFGHTRLTEVLKPRADDPALPWGPWPWLVHNYSKRILGDLDDKPKAIYAIWNAYQQTGCGRYFAGLWTETLHIDLAWSGSQYGIHQRDPVEMNRKYGQAYGNNQLFKYPTYSWLYYDGEVGFPPLALGRWDLDVSKGDDISRAIELIRYPDPDNFGDVTRNEPLVVKGRVRYVVVPQWKRKPSSNSDEETAQSDDKDVPPHTVSCYNTGIWDQKKKRFNSHMEPYFPYEIGKISFDFFNKDLLGHLVDEDLGAQPTFLECLLLCTRGPLETRTYYRNGGPSGHPQPYQGPAGRKAFALVVLPTSLTEKTNKRLRVGLMVGNQASALYFDGGREVEYELF